MDNQPASSVPHDRSEVEQAIIGASRAWALQSLAEEPDTNQHKVADELKIKPDRYSRFANGLRMADAFWRQLCAAKPLLRALYNGRVRSFGYPQLVEEDGAPQFGTRNAPSTNMRAQTTQSSDGYGDEDLPTSTSGADAWRQTRAGIDLVRTLDAELRAPLRQTSTLAKWERVCWVLCRRLQLFVDAATDGAPVILTVVGPSVVRRGLDSSKPILFAATGRVSAPPDGKDAVHLLQFMSGNPPTFVHPPLETPPIVPRERLSKGLVLWACHGKPGEGLAQDTVQIFDFVDGCGDYSSSSVRAIRASPFSHHYLEFSKATQTVQLFRAIGREPDARLIAAVDFLDDHWLDTCGCAWMIEAVNRALAAVIEPGGAQ